MDDTEYNIPSLSKHSIITSIPVKGCSHCLDNQRGIAKSCATSMVQKKILLYKIKSNYLISKVALSLWPFDYGTNYDVVPPLRRSQNIETFSDTCLC